MGIIPIPPPLPPPRWGRVGPEPLVDLEKGPLVELPLLFRGLDAFGFLAAAVPFFAPLLPRYGKPPRPYDPLPLKLLVLEVRDLAPAFFLAMPITSAAGSIDT